MLRVGDQDLNQPGHQELPGTVFGVHQLLGLDVIARASALDHVTGEGKGSSAKTDDSQGVAIGARSAEVSGYLFNGLGHVTKLFHSVGSEGLDLLQGPHRLMNYRPFAIHKFEIHSHWSKRQQQIREDDGCVHIEDFRCGDGYFRSDRGRAADIQQGMMLANGHVFRHITARLAQKPNRRAIHGLA